MVSLSAALAGLNDRPHLAATVTALSATLAYLITYFIKYPIYVLPLTQDLQGIQLKEWLSLANTVGFGLSKIPAYMYVAQLEPNNRLKLLLLLITLMIVLMNVFFAVLPPAGQVAGIFLGALPGSWVYGTMAQYLEGRRSTEASMAVVNLGIVFGGASSRALGKTYLSFVKGNWMPLAVAATFFPASVGFFVLLHFLPRPSSKDSESRSKRQPMTSTERSSFLMRFAPGFVLIFLNYALLTAFRSFRDYFASNVYHGVLNRPVHSSDYLIADWPGGVISSLGMASLGYVTNNRNSIHVIHVLMVSGMIIVGVATLLFERNLLGGEVFLSCIGAGLYLSYGPAGSIIHERLLAVSNTPGTIAPLIFLGDCLGYLGTTALLLFKTFYNHEFDYEKMFILGCYGLAVVCGGCIVASWAYFAQKLKAIPDRSYLLDINS